MNLFTKLFKKQTSVTSILQSFNATVAKLAAHEAAMAEKVEKHIAAITAHRDGRDAALVEAGKASEVRHRIEALIGA